MSGFKDYVLGKIIDIFESIQSVGMDGNLGQSVAEFSPTAYAEIARIRDVVIAPMAYTLLALFLVLELHAITVRMEGIQGTMGIELPLKVMFKMVLCKIVIDNVGLLMDATFAVSLDIIRRIGTTSTGAGDMLVPDFIAFQRAIDDLKFGQAVMASVNVTLIGFIISLCLMFVNIIVIARFFEIMVYMAIAPIPVATLPNNELNSIAKNFFKSFAAVCLHGVLIFIILNIYLTLLRGGALGAMEGGNFNSALWSLLGFSIILAVAVKSSGSWAKSMLNAM